MAVTSATDDSLTVATLMTTEDGGFTLNGEDVPETVTLEDGRMYALTLSDGEWTATFQPREVSVALGASGDSATLRTTEAGGFTRGGEPFAGGPDMVVTAANTNRYVLTQAEDGSWSAQYLPWTPTIALGQHGGSRQFRIAENGDLTSNGTNVPVGALILGDNGLRYRISRQDDQWTASYAPEPPVTVALGASGSEVTLVQNEDSTWMIEDGAAVQDGSPVDAANGNRYTLSLGPGGAWSANFQPVSLPIAGTAYTAVAKEDRSGFTVTVDGEDVNLANDGFGDVGSFRVSSSGAGASRQLSGMRFDSNIRLRRVGKGTAGDEVDSDSTVADGVTGLSLNADDPETVTNEQNTKLTITFENDAAGKVATVTVPVGDLFDDGSAVGSYDNVVAEARNEIQKRLASLERYANLIDLDPDDDETALKYTTDLNRLWKETNDQLRMIFDNKFELEGSETGVGDPGARTVSAPRRRGAADPEAMKRTFQEVIDALSTPDEFVKATRDNGDGIFEDVRPKLSMDRALQAFDAEEHEGKVRFGFTENTRFGAAWRRTFETATDRDPDDLQQGSFAYSILPKASNRQAVGMAIPTGVATYQGRTVAMSDEKGEDTPDFFQGDIEVAVRLITNAVTGLVTNMVDNDGDPLESFGFPVQSINLPRATLGYNAKYEEDRGATATVRYTLQAGSPAPTTVRTTAFAGDILGTGNDTAQATMGLWRLKGAGLNLLGSFGAERGVAQEIPRPTIADDGGKIETQLVGAYSDGVANAFDDGAAESTKHPYYLIVDDGQLRFLEEVTTVQNGEEIITRSAVEAPPATFFNDADGTIVLAGTKWSARVRAEVEGELAAYLRVVPLGADRTSAEYSTYVSRRAEIWQSVDDQLDYIFDGDSAGGTARLDRGDVAATDTRLRRVVPTSDDSVIAELESVIEALESKTAFIDAFAAGGVFDRDEAHNYITTREPTAESRYVADNDLSMVVKLWSVELLDAREDTGLTENYPGVTAVLLTGGGNWARELTPGCPRGWVVADADGNILAHNTNAAVIPAGYVRERIISSYDSTTGNAIYAAPAQTDRYVREDTMNGPNPVFLKAYLFDGGDTYFFGHGMDGTQPAIAASVTSGPYKSDAAGEILADRSAVPPSADPYDLPQSVTGNTVDESRPGVFHIGRSGAPGSAYDQVDWKAPVEYRATDFTRFGFWRRRVSRAAARPDGADNSERFGAGVAYAYSPLEQTLYASGDPNFPTGAVGMSYRGETVAYGGGKTYEGDVNLRVNWTALNEASGTAESTVILEIANLVTKDLGQAILLHAPDVAGSDSPNNKQAVRTIRFVETFMPRGGQALTFSAADVTAMEVSLETDRGEVQLVTALDVDSDRHEVTAAAFLTGAFVGQNARGPLGVIGRWGLDGLERWDPENIDKETFRVKEQLPDLRLIGAFGADLVQ